MPYNDSTGEYIPPKAGAYFGDLYNVGAGAADYAERTVKPQFQSRVIDHLPEGQIVAWRLMLEDTQGGLNLTQGRFDTDYDRVSSSTLDTRFYRTLVNPQLLTIQTTPVLGSTIFATGTHNAMFNGVLYIAGGLTANAAILKETSATDPTLIAVTYDPGAGNNITALNTGTFGSIAGATNAPYLIVGRPAPAVAQVLNSAHTVFDTALTGCWGVIQTTLNGGQWLCYYDGRIGVLDIINQPINGVPTPALTNVPNGGCALGLAKIAGAPLRPYWIWPQGVDHLVAAGTGLPSKVMSTNQNGIDPQLVPMGLETVVSAKIINDSAIVATDEKRVMYYDGRSAARDLFAISQREADSDRELRTLGFAVNGNEVITEINARRATSGSASVFTQRWLESYNLETNAWHRISRIQDMGSTTSNASAPTPAGLHLSATTGFMHTFVEMGSSGRGWNRMFIPPYGYNPYNQLRQSSGAGSSTGYEFESSGTYTSPYFTLPGLEGSPSMVSRITFAGDVDSGGTSGTAATVVVTAGNMSTTFGTGLSRRAQLVDMTDNGETFYQLQITITQTRNSGSTRWTPQGLPVIIEGYTWVPTLPPPYGWVDDGR